MAETGTDTLSINLSDVADSFDDEFFIIDRNFKIILANQAMAQKLGIEKRLLAGKLCYEVLNDKEGPCSSPTWVCPHHKVLQTGGAVKITHRQDKTGPEHYTEVTAYPLRDKDGEITAIAEMRRDVTAEHQLESQVLKRHHQLLALSHISSAVRGLIDLDTVLGIALDNVLEIINGVTGGIMLLDERTKVLKYQVHRGLSDRYAGEVEVKLGEGIAGKVAQSGQPILLEDISKDTRTAHPSLINTEGLKGFISVPLKVKDSAIGVMNIASHQAGKFGADDVSLLNSIGDYLGTAIEQTKLYQRLDTAKVRYQTLLQHTLTAQENERKRIARELHDETSQALTSITLSMQAIIQLAEKAGVKDAKLTEMIKNTHNYAVHTQNEVVKLMKELRPTLLDELGLAAAINRCAKDNLQTHGINVETNFTGTDKRLLPAIEVTLFRIAQGAIGNILEHSEAENVLVKLDCSDTECKLRIEDDGKGFDISKLTRVAPSGRGAGVFTMKERAKLVYGTCRIVSQPGKGTTVLVRIPLEPEVPFDEEDQGTDS